MKETEGRDKGHRSYSYVPACLGISVAPDVPALTSRDSKSPRMLCLVWYDACIQAIGEFKDQG